jgi:hypothetical protein
MPKHSGSNRNRLIPDRWVTASLTFRLMGEAPNSSVSFIDGAELDLRLDDVPGHDLNVRWENMEKMARSPESCAEDSGDLAQRRLQILDCLPDNQHPNHALFSMTPKRADVLVTARLIWGSE